MRDNFTSSFVVVSHLHTECKSMMVCVVESATVSYSIKTDKENPRCKSSAGFVLALPIFPVSHPTSIFGENELNFCVRYGNRWTLIPISTNYSVRCALKTGHHETAFLRDTSEPAYYCRSSPRLISIGQLHASQRFHLRPIYDIVYVEPYSFSG